MHMLLLARCDAHARVISLCRYSPCDVDTHLSTRRRTHASIDTGDGASNQHMVRTHTTHMHMTRALHASDAYVLCACACACACVCAECMHPLVVSLSHPVLLSTRVCGADTSHAPSWDSPMVNTSTTTCEQQEQEQSRSRVRGMRMSACSVHVDHVSTHAMERHPPYLQWANRPCSTR